MKLNVIEEKSTTLSYRVDAPDDIKPCCGVIPVIEMREHIYEGEIEFEVNLLICLNCNKQLAILGRATKAEDIRITPRHAKAWNEGLPRRPTWHLR